MRPRSALSLLLLVSFAFVALCGDVVHHRFAHNVQGSGQPGLCEAHHWHHGHAHTHAATVPEDDTEPADQEPRSADDCAVCVFLAASFTAVQQDHFIDLEGVSWQQQISPSRPAIVTGSSQWTRAPPC